MIPSIRRHPKTAYVVVAYAVSWLVAVPLMTDDAPGRLHLAVALGPAVAALVVTGIVAGRAGLGSLWDRARAWRSFPSWRWWVIAFSPLGYLGIGMLITALAGRWPDEIDGNEAFGGEGWIIGLVGAGLAFGVLEELGWRGFLLPRLQATRTASMASFFLWLIWAGWHAPMFVYHFDFSLGLAAGWLISLYFGTVFVAVLHNSTGGSVLAAIVFHVALTTASIMGEAVADIAVMTIGAGVIVATIVAARWGGNADLSRYGRYIITDP
jgi:membrane protease YdiL (CAAX protease family)